MPEEKAGESGASARLFEIARNLECKIDFSDDAQNKVSPVFSLDEMLSKLIGLLVYCGASVPIHSFPPYQRVHADVEFWKKHLIEPAPEEQKPEAPALDPPCDPAAEPPADAQKETEPPKPEG